MSLPDPIPDQEIARLKIRIGGQLKIRLPHLFIQVILVPVLEHMPDCEAGQFPCVSVVDDHDHASRIGG
jgi:hypothetical protein